MRVSFKVYLLPGNSVECRKCSDTCGVNWSLTPTTTLYIIIFCLPGHVRNMTARCGMQLAKHQGGWEQTVSLCRFHFQSHFFLHSISNSVDQVYIPLPTDQVGHWEKGSASFGYDGLMVGLNDHPVDVTVVKEAAVSGVLMLSLNVVLERRKTQKTDSGNLLEAY
ncbi:hypothetical protein RRG08_011734 [Elysia crispata]|uniref:Uncharacterized protein n=1 Tax=Elysia crispata TaxID=231223 RepID=A0AAE1DYN5_9GAST|nr:hypothetical protein RRG08_011734 [Elysia crispata]